MKCVLIPLTVEIVEYSCDTVLWFLSWTVDRAMERCLDVLPSPSTCTSDRGPWSTPAVHWRSMLYTLSWCRRWTSRETPSHVEDREEIRAASGCTWTACSHSDSVVVSASDLCNIYASKYQSQSAKKRTCAFRHKYSILAFPLLSKHVVIYAWESEQNLKL